MAACVLAPAAFAVPAPTGQAAADAGTPVLVSSMDTPPAGYRLTGTQVQRIASRVPKIVAVVHRHRGAHDYVYTKGPGQWQVSWFTGQGSSTKEIAQVYVADDTGKATQAWTGFQVAWTMARGYPGAFGARVSALYIWLPLCALFIFPFLPWRRRPTLLHLDLLALLGFSISFAYFNHGNLGLSTPLIYPFLAYLLVRMLLLANGKGVPREPLRLLVPPYWLAIAIVFLVGFRIGLNVTNSNVIDVGYAGVIGASKLVHGVPLYGHWPTSNLYGDTYGPVTYFAYVPFQQIFGWSGVWDSLPAAHAASITFDVLTTIALFVLGWRLRGRTLGIVLAYLWVSYPFALFVLASDSNDSLVALLLVVTMLAASSAPARGVAAALAGLTKFAPLGLGPLLLRGPDGAWRVRSTALYVVAFALTALAAFLPVLIHHDLHAFWHDSIAYQATRSAPFSVWGFYGGLSLAQHLVQGAVGALAVAVAFVPRRRDPITVAALAAAVIIALQLTVTYWFYLYVVWFFPLVIVATLGSCPARADAGRNSQGDRARRRALPRVHSLGRLGRAEPPEVVVDTTGGGAPA